MFPVLTCFVVVVVVVVVVLVAGVVCCCCCRDRRWYCWRYSFFMLLLIIVLLFLFCYVSCLILVNGLNPRVSVVDLSSVIVRVRVVCRKDCRCWWLTFRLLDERYVVIFRFKWNWSCRLFSFAHNVVRDCRCRIWWLLVLFFVCLFVFVLLLILPLLLFLYTYWKYWSFLQQNTSQSS